MSSQESHDDRRRAKSLSQVAAGRRRLRLAPPPSRLSWPGATNQPTNLPQSLSATSTQNSQNNSRKRTRAHVASDPLSNGGTEGESSQLWTDQYAPTCRDELCIAAKKVSEVAKWIEEESSVLKLLVLVGRPGIGKSTMIRVLADELNIDVLEWNDSYSQWSNEVESLSPLNSFAKFLQQSGAGFSSLNLTTTAASDTGGVLSRNVSSPRRRLILLEELPNLANPDMQRQFRLIFTQHLQTTHVPTIWIYSDGAEGQSKPQDLERHVEAPVLYQNSKIMQINPSTKSQLKKCLERIAKAETFKLNKQICEQWHALSGGDVRYAIMALQFDQAGRSSTSKQKAPLLAKKAKTTSIMENNGTSRDTQWTAFHALGKILYAKRESVKEGAPPLPDGERPPLVFDPEQVLEHCELDLGHALTYLGFHAADFYSDVEELSSAMDLYSDASYLLEQTTNYNYQRRFAQTTISCPIFPEGYVTSLASRAVAHTNLHPAPSRFRKLNAPKLLEVRRKAKENAVELHRLQQRLSLLTVSSTTVAATSVKDLSSFVTDRLPFLRSILPHVVNASLDQLHTIGSDVNGASASNYYTWQQQQEADLVAMLEKEQREIFEVDDIDEYSSNDENDEEVMVLDKVQSNPFSNTEKSQPGSNGNMSAQQSSSAINANSMRNNESGWNTSAPQKQSNIRVSSRPTQTISNPYRNKVKKTIPPSTQARFSPSQSIPSTTRMTSPPRPPLISTLTVQSSLSVPPLDEAGVASNKEDHMNPLEYENQVPNNGRKPSGKILMDV